MAEDISEHFDRDHHVPGTDSGGALIPPENLEPMHKGEKPFYAGGVELNFEVAGSKGDEIPPEEIDPDVLARLTRKEVGKFAAGLVLPTPEEIPKEVGPDVYLG